MSAYRFCRSDDIALLVDALNRCGAPSFPDDPPITAAAFKRSIRDLQVWCSSCMVAFEGPDPIGVLIGAKRPTGTLIHKIAVHPDHQRQGHGGHMLGSLSSKLAILGPPTIVAEVPESLTAARRLFAAGGYLERTRLTDYVLDWNEADGLAQPLDSDPRARHNGYIVPITIDDLAANDVLREPQRCWERSVETLTARKDEIAGLAVASDERIEAFVAYVDTGAGSADIMLLRSLLDDGAARLKQLLARLRQRDIKRLRFAKVHPAEISKEYLSALGFESANAHLVYAATARSQ